jgi:hypothetical protein
MATKKFQSYFIEQVRSNISNADPPSGLFSRISLTPLIGHPLVVTMNFVRIVEEYH